MNDIALANETARSSALNSNTPTFHTIHKIPARSGAAVRLKKGEFITVINTPGHQVCDFWAFTETLPAQHLSMDHNHTSLGSIFPKVGDELVSNRREPLLTIIEDTSPGIHDTLIACCDRRRYQQLGCVEYHDNCEDNMVNALQNLEQAPPIPATPAPFNLWMNVPIAQDGTTSWMAPVSAPGDKMTFRAEQDLIAVMSACPQDVTPVNGANCSPSELHYSIAPAING
ncbi:MAG: urea carboxylase-associated family protein [Oceanospirillaceae bacterium]